MSATITFSRRAAAIEWRHYDFLGLDLANLAKRNGRGNDNLAIHRVVVALVRNEEGIMTFKITRIFQHFVDGIPQISPFPDEAIDPPIGVNDLDVRIKHFTEIENFTLLADLLARQIQARDNDLHPIATIQNLTVSAPDIQARIDTAKPVQVNAERLGAFILDVGLNWEHNVASFNNLVVPGKPLQVSDPILQARIDSLDDLTEALVNEVNLRAREVFRNDRRKL